MPPVWDQLNLTAVVQQILVAQPRNQKYNTGRPFLSAYQIAIEIANQHPMIVQQLGQSHGGEGQGPYALTTYIARVLIQRIRDGHIPDMEVRFLSPLHLKTLTFNENGRDMTATTNTAGFDLTMFRSLV